MITSRNHLTIIHFLLIIGATVAALGCEDTTTICLAGSKTCSGQSVVMVCDRKGRSWGVYANCPLGSYCRGGVCLVPPSSCKNGSCEASLSETCNTCPEDCGKCCGNGVCEATYAEDFYTCFADCGPKMDSGGTTPDKGVSLLDKSTALDNGGATPDSGGITPDSGGGASDAKHSH